MEHINITLRAFDEKGYHKDILIACSRQVRMNDIRVKEPTKSMWSGLIGHGGSILIEDFPEIVAFELVITKD